MLRTIGFSLGITAAVLGAGLTVHGLQVEQEGNALQDRRLDPTLPLVAEPDLATARRGQRLARLRIPAIEVDEVVVEGVSGRELAVGLGHYPSTPLFGDTGAVGVAGHRTGWGDPLLRLHELDRGDRIIVQTRASRVVYAVTRSVVVEPSERWVLKGDPVVDADEELTLTTCTPIGTSRDRLIVWAQRIR